MRPEDVAEEPQRLDLFALPSNTDLRFMLLVLVAIATSTMMYSFLYYYPGLYGREAAADMKRCMDASAPLRRPPAHGDWVAYVNDQQHWSVEFGKCRAPSERHRAASASAAVAAMFVAAAALYWFMPGWKRRRRRLSTLPSGARTELGRALDELARESGVRRPTIVVDPFDANPTGAVAFGRLGMNYIKLSAGVISRLRKDPLAFRAVVLHELAHIRNGDIDKSQFTLAVLIVFALFAFLPFGLDFVITSGESLGIALRATLLGALLVYAGTAVLRARELYADARLAQWRETSALRAVLQRLKPVRGIRRLWHFHPTPAERIQALHQPSAILRTSFGEALAVGVASGVTFSNLTDYVGAFMSGTGWMPLRVPALVTIPLGMAILGMAVSRAAFVGTDSRDHNVRPWLISFGVSVGLLLGERFSFASMAKPKQPPWSLDVLALLALTMLTYLFLRWLQSSVWVDRRAGETFPRLRQLTIVALGCLAFGYGFGEFAGLRWLLSALPLEFAPLVLGGYVFSQIGAASHLHLGLAFSAWAIPFSVWLLPRRRELDFSTVRWSCVLRHPAIVAAVAAAALFFVALVLMHASVRGEPDASTESFRIVFYLVRAALADLLLVVVTVRVACVARHLALPCSGGAALLSAALMTAGWFAAAALFDWPSTASSLSIFASIAYTASWLSLPAALLLTAPPPSDHRDSASVASPHGRDDDPELPAPAIS